MVLGQIAAHETSDALGASAAALPAFHAFTGCDTVSGFNKKGKKKVLYIWDIWKIFPASTPVFIALSNAQSAIAEEWGTILERFVVLLYDGTSSSSSVNDSRKQLFTRKDRKFAI